MIRVRVSGPIFRILFMVRVRVRVIIGCAVIFNMSTCALIKLQSVQCFFYPPAFYVCTPGHVIMMTPHSNITLTIKGY